MPRGKCVQWAGDHVVDAGWRVTGIPDVRVAGVQCEQRRIRFLVWGWGSVGREWGGEIKKEREQ